MSDESRRFTDREVALVLRHAAEIDEREGREAAGALSQHDLREIAREVGISPEAVDRAVTELGRRTAPAVLVGAPLVRRAVHEVPGALDQGAITRLLQLVDDGTDGAGNVTEALGVVRWTSEDRLSSMQVSLAPGEGRTRIQVVEKVRPRVRRIFHLLPAAWGAMLAGPLAASLEPTTAVVAGLLAAGVVGGAGLGRVAWSWFSTRSEVKTARLASALAQEAERLRSPDSSP